MDIYQIIRKRHSVRSYSSKPVEDDKLHRILEAGRLSPSARNDQARKFIVVQNPATREALAKSSGMEFLAQAPVIVAAVSTDPARVMHCGVAAGPVDCAIAIDHMALVATAEGLGSCWVGHFDQDACRKLLAVPPTAQVIDLLTLGYADEDAPRPQSRKAFDEVVCNERYS